MASLRNFVSSTHLFNFRGDHENLTKLNQKSLNWLRIIISRRVNPILPTIRGGQIWVHVYVSGACLCAQIFMKLFLVALYYLISLIFKSHKDLIFGCGDICKTIRMFVWSLIFFNFCIFSKFEHQSSTQVWKLYKTNWNIWKLYIKIFGYQWKYGSNSSLYDAFE